MNPRLCKLTGCLSATCAFLLMSINSAIGEDTPTEKWTNRIQLNVSADDAIKSQVTSYIMREFRSLGDVEAVDDKPDLRISVLAMKLKSATTSYSPGFAFSVVITRPIDMQIFRSLFATTVDPKALKFLESFTKDSEILEDQFVYTGGSQDLQKLCKDVVADVDAKYFERSRKAWNQLQEALKSHSPAPK